MCSLKVRWLSENVWTMITLGKAFMKIVHYQYYGSVEITRKWYDSFRDVANNYSNRKITEPMKRAVKSSTCINLYEGKGNLYFSLFKIFLDGWMAIRVSLLSRNWISFLGKPEGEETSFNSSLQYKPYRSVAIHDDGNCRILLILSTWHNSFRCCSS